ncbi:LTA synthase family protein [Prevotella sp. OH937_COT-195]|uniref:LTA synthase family protein n=1 Tax=Prevotella sp. OH937_COT-195 TaxID=2491051 RepID=UPI000F6530EF|nr:alkaline phosphatase family protein [Prevotella sp. OH937_COT-195]RRD02590.1 alkaline phosphatase family protein [Prevotella sp. OH937_COT-195]
MKRFGKTITFLLKIHLLGLAMLSMFRITEFVALKDLLTPAVKGETWLQTGAFVRGVWFDNVTACYIMVAPMFVVMLAACFHSHNRGWRRFAVWWFSIFYTLAFAVSAANIPYFGFFFKNINSGIFEWFGYTGTTAGMMFQESSWWLYIILFIVVTAIFVRLLWFIEKRTFVDIRGTDAGKRRPSGIALRLVVTSVLLGLCFFGIRGRTGYNPIKISAAYYCNDSFLNQLGINPAFNLLTSALDDMRKENRSLNLMPTAEAVTIARHSLGITGSVDSLYVLRREMAGDSVKSRPNVVIILMESMSANFMKSFGAREELTPVLDRLYKTSLSFSNFYSTGIHTNMGMTGTLYSCPAIMKRNLMKGTVTPRRTGLPTVLKENGYHNMFFMTHESQYDNMKAFFAQNGYDDIYAQEDYPADKVVNAFGVNDGFLFEFALDKINRQAKTGKPFMATVLTISNHPPYVIPEGFKCRSKEPETQIVEYADRCIGDFLQAAQRQPWYDNTIFVVLADHGKLVGKADAELPQSYNHIPLMMFGCGIQPQVYEGPGCQIDVMPTLLGIMGIGYTFDGFGQDLLRHPREMVFYSADNQIVARNNEQVFIYSPEMQKSFTYGVMPGWQLAEMKPGAATDVLRRYVFAMIETAEFNERQSRCR